MRYFIIVVLLYFVRIFSQGQERIFTFSGTVRDAETRQPLTTVIVRVLNTAKGTVGGSDGSFCISLLEGTYTFVISSVGYVPDTLHIILNANVTRAIELQPSLIQMPEVVTTAEDPGVGIIRKAIASKRKWMDNLRSYQFEAYTRTVLNKDTTITSISESYTTGYWRKDDGLREVVRQRRQTQNIRAEQNFARVGQILNFNDDEIIFHGHIFVGPTAPEALDNYDFKLERTYESKGVRIYELRVKPTSTMKPLWEGTISIADSTFAVMKVNVSPNGAFKLPFVSDLKVHCQQQFGLFDRVYWMPVDITYQISLSISIPGISLPNLLVERRSVLYEYTINQAIPDTIFQKQHVTTDSTATKFDSTYWVRNEVLPLTAVEQSAYKTLDSTATLEKQLQPGGVLATLGNALTSAPVRYLDLRFNRVEGAFVGGQASFDGVLTSRTTISGNVGYGFSDKVWKWKGGLRQRLLLRPSLSVGVEIYRDLSYRPDANFYGSFLISLNALFDKNDYRDYYLASGWNASVHFEPLRWLFLDAGYRSEKQTTVQNNTDFSLLARSRSFRENPPICEGNLRSVKVSLGLNYNILPVRFISDSLLGREMPLTISIEHSDAVLGSDFDFTLCSAIFSMRQTTFLPSLLFAPYLNIRAAAGTSRGVLPPQRLFDLESRYSDIAPFGVLRGANVKEFTGDSYISIALEHNFRSIPFRLLGISFLDEASIELLLSCAAGRTWLRDETKNGLKNVMPSEIQSMDGWYYEAGFGISRILAFFRVDFTWRLTQLRGDSFFFSVSAAELF